MLFVVFHFYVNAVACITLLALRRYFVLLNHCLIIITQITGWLTCYVLLRILSFVNGAVAKFARYWSGSRSLKVSKIFIPLKSIWPKFHNPTKVYKIISHLHLFALQVHLGKRYKIITPQGPKT